MPRKTMQYRQRNFGGFSVSASGIRPANPLLPSAAKTTQPDAAAYHLWNLSFNPTAGQSKSMTAALGSADKTGKFRTKTVSVVANWRQCNRLPPILLAKDSLRVNNCGKPILMRPEDQRHATAGSSAAKSWAAKNVKPFPGAAAKALWCSGERS
jgi:hypothetical protein